jgi:hypothetical protein
MSIRMFPTYERSRQVVRRIIVGMVVKVSVCVGAVVAGAYGWVLMASLIFCFGVHHRELLEFPYTQWAEAASLFHTVSWQVKMWIITAAVPPSAVVLIALITLVRFGRPLKRPLYGASEWADLGQMQAGGVQTRHRPSDF